MVMDVYDHLSPAGNPQDVALWLSDWQVCSSAWRQRCMPSTTKPDGPWVPRSRLATTGSSAVCARTAPSSAALLWTVKPYTSCTTKD